MVPAEKLYKLFRVRLLAFFMAKQIYRELAEDFVQDVFFRYHKAEYELSEEKAGAVLFRIAQNVYIDHVRRGKRQRALGIADGQMLDVTETLETPDQAVDVQTALEARQELSCVLEKLKRLPPKCREVFIDYRFRNLTQKQIAKNRGISLSMVEKHMSTALIRLREKNDET